MEVKHYKQTVNYIIQLNKIAKMMETCLIVVNDSKLKQTLQEMYLEKDGRIDREQ